MTILFNNHPLELPDPSMTVADLAELKNIPGQGTAIAVNDKLIPKRNWVVTPLNEMDVVTVISAAYGG